MSFLPSSARLLLTFLLLTQSLSSPAVERESLPHTRQQIIYTVETVPDPKLSPGWNYVSNPDSVISASTVEEINTSLKSLEDSTTAQVAVVILNSIGDEVP